MLRKTLLFLCFWLNFGLLSSVWSAPAGVRFYHSAVDEGQQGEALELSANIPKKGNLNAIQVRIRLKEKGAFQTWWMRNISGDYYEAKIPGKLLNPPLAEYYIIGLTSNGKSVALFASADKPQRVKILPSKKRGLLKEALDLFSAEIKIFSAARRVQNISDSPSAITVLSQKDILNVGSVSLPEILRQVPGMDVMFITRSDANLSIRGFNREGANKLLALVDGRSAYVDLFGITFWESLPLSILEIDRIEVIRGPGSALYGANAFTGVVNIYTIKPWKMKGMRYWVQAGPGSTYATFVGGGKSGLGSFRMSATYNRQSSFEDIDKEAFESIKGHGTFAYRWSKLRYVQVTGGFSRDRSERIQSLIGDFRIKATQGFAKFNVQLDGFRAQLWWNVLAADLSYSFPLPKKIEFPINETTKIPINLESLGVTSLGPDLIQLQSHTVDLEVQQAFNFWKKRNRLVLGGNFRLNYASSDQFSAKENTQLLGALFVQNELRPVKWFTLTLGGRFDFQASQMENIPTHYRFSPHGTILLKPHPAHTFRFTGAMAFRYPAFFESGLQLELVPGGTVNGKTLPPLMFNAEPELQPETIISAEFGYSARIQKRLIIGIDVYYQQVRDLILLQGDVGAIFSYFLMKNGLAPIPKDMKQLFSFTNDISAWTIGGEVSLKFLFTRWLEGFINYAYQSISFLEIKNTDLDKICLPRQKCPPLIDENTPAHKVNFGVNVKARYVRFNLMGHYIHGTRRVNFLTRIPNAVIELEGNQRRLRDLSKAEAYFEIPAQFLLNANIAVPLWNDRISLGITLFNIVGMFTGGLSPIQGDGFVRDKNGKITGVQEGYLLQYPRLQLFGKVTGGELIGSRIHVFIRGKL
jgi:iron complex outermembrane receptor protein